MSLYTFLFLFVLFALVILATYAPTIIREWRYRRGLWLLRRHYDVRPRFDPSPAIRRALAFRMSLLSVFLRDIDLGGVVTALDGVEESVKTAVATSAPVVQLEDQTVASVGSAAQQVIVNAVTKYAPSATTIAEEVTTPLLAGLEAYVEHFMQNATEAKPAA